MSKQDYNFRIDEKSIKSISKILAGEVADRIYHEFLFMRYIPEVVDIEKGKVVPMKTEDFKRQLIYRINSKCK